MVDSAFNEMDDFPSFFHGLGYHTSMVWCSSLTFDKKHPFVFRGRKPVKHKETIGRFPKWFDDIYHYYPTKDQAEAMGIGRNDVEYPSAWIPDRITTKQFIYHFHTLMKEHPDKPHFGLYGNVGTHLPFDGYDHKKYFEQFKVGNGVTGDYVSTRDRNDMYATVLKSATYYIKEIYDSLVGTNTIFVLVGDHGAREVIIYNPGDEVTEGIDFREDCMHLNSGNDNIYLTSGIFGYLGSDLVIRDLLKDYVGKTLTAVADHQDFVLTLYRFISKIANTRLTSSRIGTDLLDAFRNATDNKPIHINPRYSI